MVDETNQSSVTEADGGATENDNKEPALVPSFRLKEESEKRRQAETKVSEYETQLTEAKNQIQQVKFETEKTYAKEIYGDYVEDPAVQEYKTKYPDLGYKQIFGALGIEVPTQHGVYSPSPSRSSGSLSGVSGDSEYTVAQITELRSSNMEEYRRIMKDYGLGKVKVIA